MSKASTSVLIAAGLTAASGALAGTVTVVNTDAANVAVAPDNGCVDDTNGTGQGGITRTIQITETGTINDVNVGLEMTQTWRSDIQVGLAYTGGGGTIQLVNNFDSSGDNLNLIADSQAAALCSSTTHCGTAANCVTPPGPTCQPNQSLSAFNGLATPGTFTLTVCDRAAADTGNLTSWSITAELDIVPAVPPQFAYDPTSGSAVNFTGGTTIGSTGNGSVAVSVGTAGVGTGAAATTTLTCTAPSAPFSGFGQSVTAEGAGAISGGPLTGTCTLGDTQVVQTLNCSENQGGTPVSRSFQLTCPAGTPVADLQTSITATPSPATPGLPINFDASVLNAGPNSAGDVQLNVALGAGVGFVSATPSMGGTCTTPAVNAGGSVNCTWAGATASGSTRSVAVVGVSYERSAGASASASSTAQDPTPGNNAASASVSVGAGQAVPPPAFIPSSSHWSIALLTAFMGLMAGLFLYRRQG